MQAQPLLLIYAIFCVAGFISGVQTPIPYAAVIAHWFDSHRGIALGLATAGVGLGVALIPQLAALLIGHFGWRSAYVGLGIAVVVLAWLPVVLFVREPPWVRRRAAPAPRAQRRCPASTPRRRWRRGTSGSCRSRSFSVSWRSTAPSFMSSRSSPIAACRCSRNRRALGRRHRHHRRPGHLRLVSRSVLGPYVAVCFFVLPMLGSRCSAAGGAFPFPWWARRCAAPASAPKSI